LAAAGAHGHGDVVAVDLVAFAGDARRPERGEIHVRGPVVGVPLSVGVAAGRVSAARLAEGHVHKDLGGADVVDDRSITM